MTINVDLDPDILSRLEEESRLSGDSINAIANRVLREHLTVDKRDNNPSAPDTFALETPEKWHALTPSQILYEMDIEEYEAKRDRARHESPAVRL